MAEGVITFQSLQDMIEKLPRYCNGGHHVRVADVLTCIRIWEEKQYEYRDTEK